MLTISIVGRLICAGLLIWALFKHSYGYYVFLRWAIMAVCGLCIINLISKRSLNWAWAFGVIGAIFNPIFPIRSDKGTWAVLDVVAAIFLLISIFFVRENPVHRE